MLSNSKLLINDSPYLSSSVGSLQEISGIATVTFPSGDSFLSLIFGDFDPKTGLGSLSQQILLPSTSLTCLEEDDALKVHNLGPFNTFVLMVHPKGPAFALSTQSDDSLVEIILPITPILDNADSPMDVDLNVVSPSKSVASNSFHSTLSFYVKHTMMTSSIPAHEQLHAQVFFKNSQRHHFYRAGFKLDLPADDPSSSREVTLNNPAYHSLQQSFAI